MSFLVDLKSIFINSTFDIYMVMCKEYHKNALNPFFKNTKTVTLRLGVKKTFIVKEDLYCHVANL